MLEQPEPQDVCGHVALHSISMGDGNFSSSASACPGPFAYLPEALPCQGENVSGPPSCAFHPALQELQLDSDTSVHRAALETLKILDSCNQHCFLVARGRNT